MSKRLSGAGNIAWGLGTVVGTGAWTIAMLVKLNAGTDGSWHSMLNLKDTTNTRLGTTRRGTSNTFSVSVNNEGSFSDTAAAWSSTNGWCVLVASRPAGAAQTVAYSVCSLGNIPISGNLVGTMGNATAPTSLQFGHINSADFFNGWVAAIAFWDTNLNQTQRESLAGTLTRANWLSLTPKFLVDELDDFQTDYAGTSTRTAYTGVTDDAADDPAGWASWAPASGLIRTDCGIWVSAPSFGTGAFTTGSFTPPNNSLLVVACANMRDSGTNTTLGRPTITDSLGTHLTYNEIDFTNLTPFFSTQMTVWSAQVTTGAAMTISFDDPNNFTMFAYQACVFAFQNYNLTTPVDGVIDSGTTNILDGSHSLTLTVAPSVADYSLIFLAIDADGTAANPTLDTGWTEAFDLGSNTGGGCLVGLHRTGSASTTCLVNDVYTGTPSFYKGSMLALNVNVVEEAAPAESAYIIQPPFVRV